MYRRSLAGTRSSGENGWNGSGIGWASAGVFSPMNRGNEGAGDVLDRFHPSVASWFRDQFGEPTPPQRMGWPAIAAGENTLIVAPTGSGKTLAAFLVALDHL